MTEAPVTFDGGVLKLDICKRCELVWFDPGEYECIPPSPPKVPAPGEVDEKKLPQAAREALALYKVQQIAEQSRAEDASPDEGWKTVPALFGFPVEEETGSLKHLPWLTFSLAAVIALISISAFSDLKEGIAQFGFVPAEASRYGGFTFLSSFFLHGGVLHLVGNLYFFLIFGDNVEDFLGKWRFLLLIFAAAFFGDFLLLVAQPNSTIPCIGASGGISGVIAFYALEFPHARLGFLIRYFYRFKWIQLPAWGAFGLWVLLQLIGSVRQFAGLSNVASLAHLGGAVVGFLAWLTWGKLQLQPFPSKAKSGA